VTALQHKNGHTEFSEGALLAHAKEVTSDYSIKNNGEIATNGEEKHSIIGKKKAILWDVLDVTKWLIEIGLGVYANNFATQRVNGKALAQITKRSNDIKFIKLLEEKLHIDHFGDLMVFLEEIKQVDF